MKNKLFDEFVQKQFDGYKPEVGPHIWENIVQKKDKKKPFGFWFSNAGKVAAVFFVILSCVGYYFIQHTNTSTNEISLSKEKNTPTPINNLVENTSPSLNKNNDVLPIDKQIKSKEHSTDNKTTATTLPHKNNLALNKITKDNDNINNTPATLLTLINANNVANKATESKYIKRNATVNISKKEDEKVNNVLLKNIVEADRIKEYRLFMPIIATKKLPMLAFIPCPEVEKNAAGNKKYIEAYSGPDFIFKTYADTSDTYISQRKASAGIQHAYSAGLRYTMVFGNGISFRAGINYSQINERFIAFDGFVMQHILQVNSIGDTILNYVGATVQYKKSNNVYRTIDIPLQAGFEFGNGRLHTNISAGALVNIYSKQTGNAIEPNGNVVDLEASKTQSKYQYKSNVGVSFLGSVSVYYKLNQILHLMAEPYIRYSLSPITKPEISFKQKLHTTGIRLGLRLDL
jgi:hypothetical protein